ncbi:MAG: metallophosphoesterase [Bacillaceae bacterium]|nr:metallophosphoesterase [Bacillaceae bacterium]
MRVCVVSDTHMPRRAKEFPHQLVEELEQADLIIHAGDWQTMEIYELLRTYAPVEGVAGNVDGEEIIRRFGKKKILSLEGFRVGLVHGDGRGKTTLQRAVDAFKGEQVDAIIFGHSHIPLLEERDGIILFNPGSPTDKRRQPRYSYGVLTVGDKLTFEHRFYEVKN